MATITQEYTVNVPDELWVDSWNNENTATYTYQGPDTVYAVIENGQVTTVSVEELSSDDYPNGNIITISATAQPDVADWIHPTPEDFSHTHVTETNPDGSTWQKISNPGIRDWFQLAPALPNENNFAVQLVANIKDPTTQHEIKARQRLAYVKKYDDAYEFDNDTQLLIDTFISNMTIYLNTYAPIYPWKYISVPAGDMPKIPATLITIFNSLPDIE